MIGLAARSDAARADVAPGARGPPGPLSVAIQATGGQDVSYAIVIHNTTATPSPTPQITQQLPQAWTTSPPPRPPTAPAAT